MSFRVKIHNKAKFDRDPAKLAVMKDALQRAADAHGAEVEVTIRDEAEERIATFTATPKATARG